VTILNNSFGAPQRFVLWTGGIKARLSEHRFHIQRLELPPVTTTKTQTFSQLHRYGKKKSALE